MKNKQYLSLKDYLDLRQQEDVRKEYRKSCERAEKRKDSQLDNEKAQSFVKCLFFIGLTFAIMVVSLAFAISLVC